MKLICGIDEAGRGPLAGPVSAAAVILPGNFPREILADSKVLSEAHREAAREIILRDAAAWGIGWATHEEIDALNILRASLLAMSRAYADMRERFPGSIPGEAIVDGLYTPDLAWAVPCKALVKADSKVPEVMAASILAKTERDRKMAEYARLYPEYRYEKHKGYPTREHRALIAQYGPSPIQRLSFTLRSTTPPRTP
ncbi:MAG: ribonuclease HII [Treponema sp.]|jgi:ribonuclease HII|nr:ribonuclease HII [Treponema sp.]